MRRLLRLRRDGAIEEQLVSIRHIEAMTGLDFLSELEADEAERVSTYASE